MYTCLCLFIYVSVGISISVNNLRVKKFIIRWYVLRYSGCCETFDWLQIINMYKNYNANTSVHELFNSQIVYRYRYTTAGNRHKQNSWFCKEIREDNFRFWWRRVQEDASQFVDNLLFYCSNMLVPITSRALVEHELLPIRSTYCFSCSVLLHCLSLCPVYFGHCVVCSLISGFWLLLGIFKLWLNSGG
jgi:hypothetical protein